MRLIFALFILLSLAIDANAQSAASAIATECAKPTVGPQGRPLPLASTWQATGAQGAGWTQKYCLDLMDAGHHILPCWNYQRFGEDQLPRIASTGMPLVVRVNNLSKPLLTTWATAPDADYPGYINAANGARGELLANGKLRARLSPFGSLVPWQATANDWPRVQFFCDQCPNNPLILLDNNEEPIAKSGFETDLRFVQRFGSTPLDPAAQSTFEAASWYEHDHAMINSFRTKFNRPDVRIVTYSESSPVLSGGSAHNYIDPWDSAQDHLTRSPLFRDMRLVEWNGARLKQNPNYWTELGIWDGMSPSKCLAFYGLSTADSGQLAARMSVPLSEADLARLNDPASGKQYWGENPPLRAMRQAGQSYPPARYKGFCRGLLWMQRPRVAREYRNSTEPIVPLEPYWIQLVASVDEVWSNPTLTEFWRNGKLLVNWEWPHPVPLYASEFNYLLTTSADPPRNAVHKILTFQASGKEYDSYGEVASDSVPWPVRALCLQLGSGKQRRFLLYVQATPHAVQGVTVKIPFYKDVVVSTDLDGTFWHLREKENTIEKVAD